MRVRPLCSVVAIIGPRGGKVAARLRALPPTDAKSVRLWRRYALWRVTGQATDLRPLLEDLKRSVREYGKSIGDDLHVVQILTMLGGEARSLTPVIDQALANPDLSGPPRDELEAARRALGE